MRDNARRFVALGLAAALGVAALPASSIAEALAGEQDDETAAEEFVAETVEEEAADEAPAEADTEETADVDVAEEAGLTVDETSGVQTFSNVTSDENPTSLSIVGLPGVYETNAIAEAYAGVEAELTAQSSDGTHVDVTWTSSDESLLTIDGDGTIHGQGKSGTVLITATDAYGNSITQPLRLLTAEDMANHQLENLFTGYGDEIVIDSHTDITLYSNSVGYFVTGYSALGFDAEAMAGSVEASSSDESVVSVVVNGVSHSPSVVLTAVGHGSADVTVWVTAIAENGDSATASKTFHVTVDDSADVESEFYISLFNRSTYPCETEGRAYALYRSSGKGGSVEGVTWSSSDESLLTIDPETGRFQTQDKEGVVTVSATDSEGNTASATLQIMSRDSWVEWAAIHVGLIREFSGEESTVSTQVGTNEYAVVLDGEASELALNTTGTTLRVWGLDIQSSFGSSDVPVTVSSVYSTDESVVRWVTNFGEDWAAGILYLQLQFVGHGTADAWVTFEYESEGETHYVTKVIHVTVPDGAPVASVEVEESALSIAGLGSAEDAVTTVADDVTTQLHVEGEDGSLDGYTWESSDPSVMTVDENGYVEGQGKTGRVVITATDADGNSISKAFVLVDAASAGVSITMDGVTANADGTYSLVVDGSWNGDGSVCVSLDDVEGLKLGDWLSVATSDNSIVSVPGGMLSFVGHGTADVTVYVPVVSEYTGEEETVALTLHVTVADDYELPGSGSEGTVNGGGTTSGDDDATTGDDTPTDDGGTTTTDDNVAAADNNVATAGESTADGGTTTADDAATGGSSAATTGGTASSDEVPATGDFSGLLPSALALLGVSGVGLGALTGRRRRQ